MDWTTVDEAIRGGSSSIDIWSRIGRRLGVSLEMIVMRRRSLRAAPRRRQAPSNVLPLFAAVAGGNDALVANG